MHLVPWELSCVRGPYSLIRADQGLSGIIKPLFGEYGAVTRGVDERGHHGAAAARDVQLSKC